MLRQSILLISLGLVASSALAGDGPPPVDPIAPERASGKRSDDKFFVGINWTFGAGPAVGPEAIVGFRSTRARSNSVRGAGLDVTFPFGQGLQLGAVRLKAIDGNRSYQGELGVGYSFASGVPLLTGGLFGSHLMAGTDYLIGTGWQPYVGVHTLGKYRKPRGGVSCPSGFELAGNRCLPSIPDGFPPALP